MESDFRCRGQVYKIQDLPGAHKTVLVYDFSDDSFYPEKYDFNSKIPVRLSGGKCVIDFAEINKAPFT